VHAVRAAPFFSWIKRLEAEGLAIGQLSATADGHGSIDVRFTARRNSGS
jgi:hypothetical protein